MTLEEAVAANTVLIGYRTMRLRIRRSWKCKNSKKGEKNGRLDVSTPVKRRK